MKKIISVLLCAMLLLSNASFTAFAGEKDEAEETTEFVLELDVNKRYTDFVEDTDGLIEDDTEEKKEMTEGQKTVYIAVLVSALVVSVVILAVSLKRVPKEEDIDISGENKKKKSKEE